MCLRIEPIRRDAIKAKGRIKQSTLLKAIIKVAKRGVICYKRFNNNNLVTPYQGFRWPDKDLVKVKKFTATGMQTYHDPDKRGKWVEFITININQGLHAETNRRDARKHQHKGVTKRMIIPAGTPYILGKRGDIVALAMKLHPKNGPKRKPAKRSKRKLVSKRKKK